MHPKIARPAYEWVGAVHLIDPGNEQSLKSHGSRRKVKDEAWLGIRFIFNLLTEP